MAGDEKMEECLELIIHATLGGVKALMVCIEGFMDCDIALDIMGMIIDVKNYCKKL